MPSRILTSSSNFPVENASSETIAQVDTCVSDIGIDEIQSKTVRKQNKWKLVILNFYLTNANVAIFFL